MCADRCVACTGWLTSGGAGYTVDRAIGYGYVRHPNGVDTQFVETGTYELEVRWLYVLVV